MKIVDKLLSLAKSWRKEIDRNPDAGEAGIVEACASELEEAVRRAVKIPGEKRKAGMRVVRVRRK